MNWIEACYELACSKIRKKAEISCHKTSTVIKLVARNGRAAPDIQLHSIRQKRKTMFKRPLIYKYIFIMYFNIQLGQSYS